MLQLFGRVCRLLLLQLQLLLLLIQRVVELGALLAQCCRLGAGEKVFGNFRLDEGPKGLLLKVVGTVAVIIWITVGNIVRNIIWITV